MDDADLLTSEDFYTHDTANYARAAVALVGLSLMMGGLGVLYKIYVHHQYTREKEQARRQWMEEYHAAKSGLAANLRREVIATRRDSEMQRMKMEENEQTVSQRYKQEMREQETRYLEREQELREEKQILEEHMKKLQWEVTSLKSRTMELESKVGKQNQRIQEQAKTYEQKHRTVLSSREQEYWERERDFGG